MIWKLLLRHRGAAFLMLLSAVSCLAVGKPTMVAPESGTQVMLLIGDNISPYYRLDVDSATYVKVSGPGELRLVVRFSLPAGASSEGSWKMEVSEGAKQLTLVDKTTAVSEQTWQDSPFRPCELFKFSLNVPDGDHRYRIGLSSPIKSFAGIRYLFSSDAAREAKSAVYPIEMLEATSVEFKEKTIDFFLADSIRPVTVRVIGPTSLRVVTRLAYSGVMKGPQKYSTVIAMDSEAVSREALVTAKSPSTYFTNHKEWSVGESKTVHIDVPVGTHEVSVRLGSSSAPALAVRFTIPKEDIGK